MFRSISSPDFQEKLNSLPDIATYKELLFELMRLDKSTLTLQEFSDRYYSTIKILPEIVHQVEPEAMNALHVYRVRCVKKDEVKTPNLSLARSFSYPDPSLQVKNGRANVAGTTVFYCSDDWQTALREMKPEVGDICYLSRWRINCDRKTAYRAYLPYKSIPAENNWHVLAQKHYEKFLEFTRSNNIEKVEHMEFLYNAICEIFTMEKPGYYFSSWLAYNIIFKHSGIDFLAFPSKQTQFLGSNFAFHPNFVDQFFKLDRVYSMTMKETGENEMSHAFGKVGHMDSTNIQWRIMSELDRNILKLDSGKTYEMSITIEPNTH